MPTDPIALFDQWFADAAKQEPNDHNAMALATVDTEGQPSLRMVLLKDHGPDGFVFYTNVESHKGRALAANPKAALLFHWKSLRRQIRIEGAVTPVSNAQADAYFASRPRDAQLGAWASDQSRPMPSRAHLLARIAEYGARYALGDVPRPPDWSGYCVAPQRIEFWADKPFRLHERRLFTLTPDGDWDCQRLYP